MKPLKLKCVLFTDDGKTWHCIRQFYVEDVTSQELLNESFAGMKLQRIDTTEDKHDDPRQTLPRG